MSHPSALVPDETDYVGDFFCREVGFTYRKQFYLVVVTVELNKQLVSVLKNDQREPVLESVPTHIGIVSARIRLCDRVHLRMIPVAEAMLLAAHQALSRWFSVVDGVTYRPARAQISE